MEKNDHFKIGGSERSLGNLSGKYKRSWVEGAFDITAEESPKLAVAHTPNYLGASIGVKRINLLSWLIILIALALAVRLFQLQVVNGRRYFQLAETNRVRVKPIPAERGIIYDREMKELVQNVPSFMLTAAPQDLPRAPGERDKIIGQLSSISGINASSIEDLLKKYRNYSFESIIIKENLDYDTALKLYIQNADLPGIQVESGSHRRYLYAADSDAAPLISLSHLLGYQGKLDSEEMNNLKNQGYLLSDTLGKSGLEKIYEKELRGIYGRKKIEVNAYGKELSILAVNSPTPGKNLVLSLDASAQKKMQELVATAADRTVKRKIAALAMNPRNGEILALVSWPAFDNNKFSSGISREDYSIYANDKDHPLFNRAIAGSYPPGSTAKLIIAAAALQENIITKSTSVLSAGGIEVGGKLFKDWRSGGHGTTNVIKALAWSVNTFFYYIGGGYQKFTGLGADKIADYLKAFGLGGKTGIDLPGENAGFIPGKIWKKNVKNENWYVGDTYNLSIGQGDLLSTPLQVAVWTAAVANGGNVVTPHLGSKLIDPVTKQADIINYPARANNSVSADNLQIVREGMKECVVSGSCQALKILPFKSGGKTGTAQWSKSHPTHAWFTSFAPYDKPQIVVTVLVEEGGEGAAAALPIARDFLSWWGDKYLNKKSI